MSEPMLLWGLGLLGVALLLVAIEVFIPSAGALGIMAGLAAIGGVACLWSVSAVWGLTGLVAVIVLGPMLFLFLLNVLPSTPMGRKLIGGPSDEETAAKAMDERRKLDERKALVGAEGVALTDMRPIGKVEIDGRRYEALAETAAIDSGAGVRVTSATMLEIKVRAV